MVTAKTAEARDRASVLQPRYTLCGEAVAEARVAQDLSRLTTGIDSEVGDELRGLILAGPLARAEGGIVYRDGEPFADTPGYELLAVVRGRPERQDARLAATAAGWSRLLHARVAIRALSLQELAQVPPTRFWFHAGRGWLITLVGDPALSLEIPRLEPSDLRRQEHALALCEGLAALALTDLERDGHAGGRALLAALHRAVLACGDSLLLRRGQYADTLAARAEALDDMHAAAALRAGYRAAIGFCARPDLWQPEAGDLPSWIGSTRRALAEALVQADAERLGSARDLLGFLRHPEPLFSPPRARTRSAVLRVLQSLPLLSALDGWQSPLERLVRCSAALALSPQSPECRETAAVLLGVAGSAPSDAELARALRSLAASALPADRIEHPFARSI